MPSRQSARSSADSAPFNVLAEKLGLRRQCKTQKSPMDRRPGRGSVQRAGQHNQVQQRQKSPIAARSESMDGFGHSVQPEKEIECRSRAAVGVDEMEID